MTEELYQLWNALCIKAKVPEKMMYSTFQEILKLYDGKGRYYHTSEHIYHMLKKYEDIKEHVKDEISLKYAIWFHDVIYHSRAKDNEEQSAQKAQEILTAFGLDEMTIQAVSLLILATKKHLPLADLPDSRLLLDLDLGILGVDEQAYTQYCNKIRKEYAWVPAFIYKKNRKKVLQNFLGRERLFFTDLMYTTYEKQARTNLKAEIDSL